MKQTLLLILLIPAFFYNSYAQQRPPEFVINAVRNVEKMLNSKNDSMIVKFIESSIAEEKISNQDSLVKKLRTIREKLHGLTGDIAVEDEPDGIRMILSDDKVEKQLKMVLDFENEVVSDIFMMESPAPLNLTVDNLKATINQFEDEGMAGVIYTKINGKVILKHAFGYANKELEISNTINTIFGTGSRPIDYTVAAILLLNQKGIIDLEDKINKYFKDVPEEKNAITIRHLLTGQSGLPDFFHTNKDWDPDLAWIDRETAVNRLLSQDLLFDPGTDQKHSHGAFVLLAALIEVVTGKTYWNFIHDNFFEPAGMTSTGEYGESNGFSVSDFAAGGGPQFIGLPNIPPNWGPTSWLIKGSGGMYSSLDDLLKFYELVRSYKILDQEHNKIFRQPTVNVDGSDRGFELFSAYRPPDNEIYLLLNKTGNREKMRQLIRALERLIES